MSSSRIDVQALRSALVLCKCGAFVSRDQLRIGISRQKQEVRPPDKTKDRSWEAEVKSGESLKLKEQSRIHPDVE